MYKYFNRYIYIYIINMTSNVSQNFSETNGSKVLNIVSSNSAQVVAKGTAGASIGSGLLAIAEKASQNPAVIGSVLGVAAMIPVAGWAVIGVAGLIAVAVIAVKKLREQFTGYYSVIRIIDEFSILLQKITKMIHLTQYISATYNFDINVDEILKQLKVIFKKFDKVLANDANAYHEIESQVTGPTASIHTTLEDVVNAAKKEQSKEHNSDDDRQGGGGLQHGGGWWSDSKMGKWMSKARFNVTEWQSEFKDDVIKLNIYLTTAMGEFTIVLNVFQMDLISRSLDTSKQETRDDALKSFIQKNNLVKNSSEYRSMRIGILLHDLLTLRIDFNFCVQENTFTSVKDSDVCKEHVLDEKTLTNAGIKISDFRRLLHECIKVLKKKLENVEYGQEIRTTVTQNVIDKYTKIISDIIDSLKKTPLSTELQNTLKTFKIDSIDDSIKNELLENLDKSKELQLTKIVTRANIHDPQGGGGGGFFANLKSKFTSSPVTVQSDPNKDVLEYLKTHPYELITDQQIRKFLTDVYEYSKQEYNKTTTPVNPEMNKDNGVDAGNTGNTAAGNAVPAPATPAVAGTGNTAPGNAAASGNPNSKTNIDGGRKMKRRNNTKKYTKKYATSSSAVKRSKTYKIRI